MSKMDYNRPMYRKGNEVKVEEGNSPVQMRVYLIVRYQEKDKVKELGAKWDPEHKLWYIHEGHPNGPRFESWLHDDDKQKFGLPNNDQKFERLRRAMMKSKL